MTLQRTNAHHTEVRELADELLNTMCDLPHEGVRVFRGAVDVQHQDAKLAQLIRKQQNGQSVIDAALDGNACNSKVIIGLYKCRGRGMA
eukprot:scaffold32639_cov112-Isochrysis_galbana.AAC.9